MDRFLLITDIVNSTERTAALGDTAAAALWARHEAVARDLLVRHGGLEIDKTDGFLLLFDVAADAINYVQAYHAAITTLAISARAGLHAGPVVLRENPADHVARGAKPLEVDGLAKAVVARVMGVARGGQTLATKAAAPEGAASHGHWRLKGMLEPIELFEVDGDGSPPPDAPKAWRVVRQNDIWVPAREIKHHLPRERDAFVGREQDLHDLVGRLDAGAALVSVIGIGGTGKTRLVTHVAWTWLGDYPGGAWFCDLSEARSVDGIAYAVARALDVPLGNDDPIVQLGHAIAGRGRCLVVLDNFEQVARYAAETLGRWLDRANDAQFVVTSREVLGLAGETALALAPLASHEGIELFVARAQQAKRDFVLTEAERPHVEALVRQLDGLPLAIELAAARVRVMSTQTIVERLGQRFKLLASSGGRHTRHVTLRAMLDWSWELLSADEQAALAQISVFEGGFTLTAAEAVLALDELWPMDAVQALVDKSLVRQVEGVGPDATRFDLLVSVQAYASEKLDGGGRRADAEARHGEFFAALGTGDAIDSLGTHGGEKRRHALFAELDNTVAACRRAVARDDGVVAVNALCAAWAVLELRGPLAVMARFGGQVLAMELTPRDRACIARNCAHALDGLGHVSHAEAHYDAALELYRDVGDPRGEGSVLNSLGNVHSNKGRMDDSRAHYQAALAVYRGAGDRGNEGLVLGNLGTLNREQGEMDDARVHLEAALEIHREVGNRHLESKGLGNLGLLHMDQGRMEEARAYYEASLDLQREVGNRSGEGHVLGNLGSLHSIEGKIDEAGAHYEAALHIHREVGNRRLESMMLGNLANLHLSAGRLDEAGARYETVLECLREVGDRRSEGIVLGNLGDLYLQMGRIDQARAHYVASLNLLREVGDRCLEGGALGDMGDLQLREGQMDEARASYSGGERLLREADARYHLAMLLCGRVRLEASEGHEQTARVLLAEARSLAEQLRAGPESQLGQKLEDAQAVVERF